MMSAVPTVRRRGTKSEDADSDGLAAAQLDVWSGVNKAWSNNIAACPKITEGLFNFDLLEDGICIRCMIA